MQPDNEFLPQQGDYRNLIAFRKAECIYDVTCYFVDKFLSPTDRTIDQMTQAARSGKQNIAEGSVAGATSKESEIKLTNVARASLHELLLDYEDYLRVRNLELWGKADDRTIRTRRICAKHNDSRFYMDIIGERSDATIANIAIVLLHQADVLLAHLIERQKADFLQRGGIREQMTKARIEYRRRE